jgi:hypothetical protein
MNQTSSHDPEKSPGRFNQVDTPRFETPHCAVGMANKKISTARDATKVNAFVTQHTTIPIVDGFEMAQKSIAFRDARLGFAKMPRPALLELCKKMYTYDMSRISRDVSRKYSNCVPSSSSSWKFRKWWTFSI